jgi:integrase
MTHLRPKTVASDASLMNTTIRPSLGDVPVGRLRPIDIQEWVAMLTTRGLSASRVKQAYRLLSQLLAAAEDSGLVATNPCRRIRLPRVTESEPVILSHRQVAALVAGCPPPYRPLLEVLAYGGLRVGEAFALRRRSVDLPGRRIVVRESLSDANGQLTFQLPKTHQQRAVTLPRFLMAALEEHLEPSVAADPEALLFVGQTGQPPRYSSFRQGLATGHDGGRFVGGDSARPEGHSRLVGNRRGRQRDGCRSSAGACGRDGDHPALRATGAWEGLRDRRPARPNGRYRRRPTPGS